jgi:single-strand DNA-binding protein
MNVTVAALDVEEAEMANDAHFSVVGFVATQPKGGYTKRGSRSVSMRVGWTPRSFDQGTGEWADQPSSFITVQCYKKVAEHAAVCLRRGDPIVLRGTLRVREYEQNGVRRSSVEVIADSIGHDMSRGISVFNKAPAQVEQTAQEYEQAMAAQAGRNPLPGDAAATAPDGDKDTDHETDPDSELADAAELAEAAELESGDRTELEYPANGEFDDEARAMLTGVGEAPEPVGAST